MALQCAARDLVAVGLPPLAAPRAPLRSALPVRHQRCLHLRTRAEPEGSNSGGGNGSSSGPSGSDWDASWSSLQKQMRSQVDFRSSPPSSSTGFTSSAGSSAPGGEMPQQRRGAPRVRRVLPAQDYRSNKNSGFDASGWGGQEGARIRKAERVLLDIWTNEEFLKAGTVASLCLLVAFVCIVGPPPPDGRCSLYWC